MISLKSLKCGSLGYFGVRFYLEKIIRGGYYRQILRGINNMTTRNRKCGSSIIYIRKLLYRFICLVLVFGSESLETFRRCFWGMLWELPLFWFFINIFVSYFRPLDPFCDKRMVLLK